MSGIIALVAGYSDRIQDGRTMADSFRYLNDEVTELAAEVITEDGPDGIFGEAIDVMINCIDMIRKKYPDMPLDELEAKVFEYTRTKCDKWETKYGTQTVRRSYVESKSANRLRRFSSARSARLYMRKRR